jgi:DNA modification methylase
MSKTNIRDKIAVQYVPIGSLKAAEYNPRKWDTAAEAQLTESIKRFGVVDPLLVNNAPKRKGIVIGGHFRLAVLKKLGIKEVPVVYVNIPDLSKEKELNLRLNKNTGVFDLELLSKFDEAFLTDIGFSSENLDDVFGVEENPEKFDLRKELEKLKISKVEVQKGDTWQLGDHRLFCGDSTVEADVMKLMGKEKADMCFTDPPYILDYLHGKKKKGGKATEGFGLKRDRKYLETDELPENFSDLWMASVAKIQKPDFSIIIFENPKNLRTIWNAMEQHWKYRNTITWRLPNRMQGFSAKFKFFNKTDFALVGTQGKVALNLNDEGELLQQEYENAIFATSGSPHWEPYQKGNKYCPTDFIDFKAADEKSSGQGIIFGTKPIEILIPYLKVLTKRDDIVIEPFGGSGSTLIACERMKRRCRLVEKVPTYAQVIIRRWEKLTGLKARKIA